MTTYLWKNFKHQDMLSQKLARVSAILKFINTEQEWQSHESTTRSAHSYEHDGDGRRHVMAGTM